jgi:hypothetical protein
MEEIMPEKTWEQMTQAEKIEDLRNDMKATMATVNSWIERQKRLGEFHNELMTKHAATAFVKKVNAIGGGRR